MTPEKEDPHVGRLDRRGPVAADVDSVEEKLI